MFFTMAGVTADNDPPLLLQLRFVTQMCPFLIGRAQNGEICAPRKTEIKTSDLNMNNNKLATILIK